MAPITNQKNELQIHDLPNFYWSRAPGKFVNKHTGQEANLCKKVKNMVVVHETEVPHVPGMPKTVVKVFQEKEVDEWTGPRFQGTVGEWYETLMESIIDASQESMNHLPNPAMMIVEASPEVAVILEHMVGFKAIQTPRFSFAEYDETKRQETFVGAMRCSTLGCVPFGTLGKFLVAKKTFPHPDDANKLRVYRFEADGITINRRTIVIGDLTVI